MSETMGEDPIRAAVARAMTALAHRNLIAAVVLVANGLLARRLHRPDPSRPKFDTGSGYVSDCRGQVRFGDYLQLLVDEQNLLRRGF